MKIVEYFSSECPEHWLSEIGRCDWRAGQFLHQLLRERRFHALLGDNIEAMQSYQSLLSSTTNTRDLGGFPISAGRWT